MTFKTTNSGPDQNAIVSIRLARLDDAYDIFLLCPAFFASGQASVTSDISNDRMIFLVATDLKEEILGYVNGMCVVDECEILNLFVKEPWRRQGIGRKLCNDFISKSKVYGCQKIFLEVRAANSAARLLYKQLDFEDNNIRKKYYDDGEDAVVMVNFLKRRTL